MKHIYSCFLAGLMFCIMPLYSIAQEEKTCGNAAILRELFAEHPELEQANQQLLLNSQQFQQQRDGSIRSIFTIPVVFHIIHEYGSENISDAQVIDQLAILNRDYRKLNADTASVIPEFDSIIADCNIEFRLATIDFAGNCTNGIEHIYSHETKNGDDYSKLNQWPRNKYLNVWVVNKMRDGVAGYAYYPSSVEGFLIFADGIIILNDYIGSIGTSNVFSSRALTHEIGHWLGLSHVWGDTNDPMVACGDDGIADTPPTRGFNFCPNDVGHISNYPTNARICTPGVTENFQNYMEYSYCSKMFTFDQSDYMNYTLSNPTAARNNLVTAENLTETGADVTSAPLCSPVADFYPSERYVCSGESVSFNDVSWRATVSNYLWSFPNGTPSTSTSANPSVIFNTPGYHSATLTVSNATGTDSKTISDAVWVSFPWVDNIGPHSEDFEGATADDWLIENPEGNSEKWQLLLGIGFSGNHCYRLNYYSNGSTSNPDPFYQNRLGNNTDNLISPAFDLSNTSSATLTFNYAAASRAPSNDEMTDELKVYSSVDCGKNWTLRKTISGPTLMSAGFTGSSFVPSALNQWSNATVNLGASVLQDNVRFKFEYTSSDYPNNIYIDDVNVNGTLGTNDVDESTFVLRLFPNPITNTQDLYIQTEVIGKNTIDIHDLSGKLIYSEQRMNDSANIMVLSCSKIGLTSGAFFITVSNETNSQTKKLIVL